MVLCSGGQMRVDVGELGGQLARVCGPGRGWRVLTLPCVLAWLPNALSSSPPVPVPDLPKDRLHAGLCRHAELPPGGLPVLHFVPGFHQPDH